MRPSKPGETTRSQLGQNHMHLPVCPLILASFIKDKKRLHISTVHPQLDSLDLNQVRHLSRHDRLPTPVAFRPKSYDIPGTPLAAVDPASCQVTQASQILTLFLHSDTAQWHPSTSYITALARLAPGHWSLLGKIGGRGSKHSGRVTALFETALARIRGARRVYPQLLIVVIF